MPFFQEKGELKKVKKSNPNKCPCKILEDLFSQKLNKTWMYSWLHSMEWKML